MPMHGVGATKQRDNHCLYLSTKPKEHIIILKGRGTLLMLVPWISLISVVNISGVPSDHFIVDLASAAPCMWARCTCRLLSPAGLPPVL